MAPRFAFVPARWLAKDSPLNPAAKLTLCILCQWVNRETGECWPSVATIAEHSGLSETTTRAAIRMCEAAGALEIERRRDAAGDPTSNCYTILGYDPPAKKTNVSNEGGGTSPGEVGVPRQPNHPPSPGEVGVPRQPQYPIKAVNGGHLNDVVNPARAADPAGAASSRARVAPTTYSGPVDRWGQPMPDLPDRVPPTQAERESWRARLRAAGVPARDQADGATISYDLPPLSPGSPAP